MSSLSIIIKYVIFLWLMSAWITPLRVWADDIVEQNDKFPPTTWIGMALFLDCPCRAPMPPIVFLNQSMSGAKELDDKKGIAMIGNTVAEGRNSAVDVFLETCPVFLKSLFGDVNNSMAYVLATAIDENTLLELKSLSELHGVQGKLDPHVWLREHLKPYVMYPRPQARESKSSHRAWKVEDAQLPTYIGGGLFFEDVGNPAGVWTMDADCLRQYLNLHDNSTRGEVVAERGDSHLFFVDESGHSAMFFIRGHSIGKVLSPLRNWEDGMKLRDMYLHYCGLTGPEGAQGTPGDRSLSY